MAALWTRDFTRITVIHFLVFVAFLMVTPVLPLYLADLGADPGWAGSALGLFTVTAVAVRLWSGGVVDRVGRRPVLVRALLWLALALLSYQLTDSLLGVLLVATLHGAGFAAATTATAAMAADMIPPQRRAEGMGFFGSSVNLAQALAPGLGLTIALSAGFGAAFGAGAGLAATALLLAWGQGETRVGNARLQGGASLEVAALVPATLAFFMTSTLGGLYALMPVYAQEHGLSNAGPFFAVFGLVVLLVRPLAGAVADRLAPVWPVTMGLASSVAAHLLIGLWPAGFRVFGLPGGLLAGAAALGLANGLVLPAGQAVSVARVSRSRWGAANATFFAALDLGVGAGSFALGWLASSLGVGPTFSWAVLLPLLGFIHVLVFREYWRLPAAGPAAGDE